MALPKIDWEEVIVKVLLGIFVIFTTGMTLYAMQGMTEEEKQI